MGQFQQHLEQARAFFEIGTKPKFDVTKAEVDLSNARLNLLRAENAFRLAQVALNNAIGLPEAPEYEIAEQLSFQRVEVDLEETLRKAYDRRPDLQSILVRKRSQEQSIELARKGYYPSLSGNASYGWGGSGGDFPLDQGWSVGAQLNIPLFTGYLTKYQIDEARANLEVLAANEALLEADHLSGRQAGMAEHAGGGGPDCGGGAVRPSGRRRIWSWPTVGTPRGWGAPSR